MEVPTVNRPAFYSARAELTREKCVDRRPTGRPRCLRRARLMTLRDHQDRSGQRGGVQATAAWADPWMADGTRAGNVSKRDGLVAARAVNGHGHPVGHGARIVAYPIPRQSRSRRKTVRRLTPG